MKLILLRLLALCALTLGVLAGCGGGGGGSSGGTAFFEFPTIHP